MCVSRMSSVRRAVEVLLAAALASGCSSSGCVADQVTSTAVTVPLRADLREDLAALSARGEGATYNTIEVEIGRNLPRVIQAYADACDTILDVSPAGLQMLSTACPIPACMLTPEICASVQYANCSRGDFPALVAAADALSASLGVTHEAAVEELCRVHAMAALIDLSVDDIDPEIARVNFTFGPAGECPPATTSADGEPVPGTGCLPQRNQQGNRRIHNPQLSWMLRRCSGHAQFDIDLGGFSGFFPDHDVAQWTVQNPAAGPQFHRFDSGLLVTSVVEADADRPLATTNVRSYAGDCQRAAGNHSGGVRNRLLQHQLEEFADGEHGVYAQPSAAFRFGAFTRLDVDLLGHVDVALSPGFYDVHGPVKNGSFQFGWGDLHMRPTPTGLGSRFFRYEIEQQVTAQINDVSASIERQVKDDLDTIQTALAQGISAALPLGAQTTVCDALPTEAAFALHLLSEVPGWEPPFDDDWLPGYPTPPYDSFTLVASATRMSSDCLPLRLAESISFAVDSRHGLTSALPLEVRDALSEYRSAGRINYVERQMLMNWTLPPPEVFESPRAVDNRALLRYLAGTVVRYGRCGDGIPEISAGESCVSCPAEFPTPCCGDGRCDESESHLACPDDCDIVCGDGACEFGESVSNCFVDCGSCGDGLCGSCGAPLGDDYQMCALDSQEFDYTPPDSDEPDFWCAGDCLAICANPRRWSCSVNADCPAGLRCDLPTVTDWTHEQGEQCWDGHDSEAVIPAPDGSGAPLDFRDGLIDCADPDCRGTPHCAGLPGVAWCEPSWPDGCSTDSDCPGGRPCVAGECRQDVCCGNGICDPGENGRFRDLCGQDCSTCGDGYCDAVENSRRCPWDCPPSCGDNFCGPGEDCESCPEDCNAGWTYRDRGDGIPTRVHTCDEPAVTCGDGVCQGGPFGEDCQTCPRDCPLYFEDGAIAPTCIGAGPSRWSPVWGAAR